MDMRRHPPELRLTRRLGALVLVVLQMVGATILPAADGQLDVEGYMTPAHVESGRSGDCVPRHDHVFCQVIRSTALANPARSTVEVAVMAEPSMAPVIRDAEAHRARSEARSDAASPRAPPSA